MKLIKQIILSGLLSFSHLLYGQGNHAMAGVSLSGYLQENVDCVSKEVIFEGCSLLLNSDGEYLFCQLNILHPEIQMRILMQGVSFYIDPTGKTREKYAVHFPDASNIKDKKKLAPPREVMTDSSEVKIPNILPLVSELSSLGAQFKIKKKMESHEEWSAISVNQEDKCLSYSFIIPVELMLTEKKLVDRWKIGLKSANSRPYDDDRGNGPMMVFPGMPEQSPESRQRIPENEGRGINVDLHEIMMNDIEEWVSFSFSEISSLN